MISQSDIAGRLRLFRYGLIVITTITFFVTVFAPYAFITNAKMTDGTKVADLEGYEGIAITEFLVPAILATLIVAVLCAVLYFGYSKFLTRDQQAEAAA